MEDQNHKANVAVPTGTAESLASTAGVQGDERTHPECDWCTLCGKRDHIEAQCPTVAGGVQASDGLNRKGGS